MDYDNLIEYSTIDVKVQDIVTVLNVLGGTSSGIQLDVAGVNPAGNSTLINVDYFLDRMSDGLRQAWLAYRSLFNSLQGQYSSLLVQLHTLNGQRQNLINQPPTYQVTFPNNNPVTGVATITPPLNSASGLNQLLSIRHALEGIKQVRIESGNVPFADVAARIAQVDPMIADRRIAITNVETQITSVQNQLSNITSQLNVRSNFTDAQWVELNRYFIEDTYQNDSFITTDLTTPTERQEIQQELFDTADRVLHRASHPAFEISVDAVNFLALPEFQDFADDLLWVELLH